jgi:adenosylcobyric acid synthase
MTARALFVGGTSSNAGKSWMATAICAWLRRNGVAVAPFKAQNMSNHSYPCTGGGEIARAQVAQAEACGLDPDPSMNPILLKPNGNGTSQVVVNGRMWKTLSAREYYAHADELRRVVLDAYTGLSRRFDAVIIEGAGSVSELNLREHDLVNLGLVTRLGCPWMLVADIERGGVFASIIGTEHLLDATERSLFRGFAINKFRGDLSLLDEGIAMLERGTGQPCLGVFPFDAKLRVDAEDSLAVRTRPLDPAPRGAATAIVLLPCISNATDFRLLTWAVWITSPTSEHYDFVIIPGTKSTIDDLEWLRRSGLAEWIVEQHRGGATVIGVCGGYQMLGRTIWNPTGVEPAAGSAAGLGLLPAQTTLMPVKQTRAVSAVTPRGVVFGAYEIHLGVTTLDTDARQPFATLSDGTPDGVRENRVLGTYLHGAFEHAGVCAEVFGIDAPAVASKEDEYAKLALWFETYGQHLDRLELF